MSDARPDIATAAPTTVARAELPRGERVLWAERAVATGPTWGSLWIVGFGLAFGGFGALWMALAFSMTGSDDGPWRFFPYFGVPFVLIGLGIATLPFWLGRVAAPTVYALSDRRAWSIHGRRRRTVRAIDLDRIGNVHFVDRRNGVGDLYFDRAFDQDEAPGDLMRLRGMFGVPDVRRVAERIDRLRAGLERAGA